MNTKVNTLKTKLNRIPHLELPLTFDANKILAEIKELPYPLMPYIAYANTGTETSWNSLALYSTDGSIFSNPKETWEGNFVESGLRDFMPYTYETLEKFKGGKLLARIEEILPHSTAGWHSHQLEAYQPDWLIVCQLPVVMPAKSKYSIVSYTEYRGSDFKESPRTFEKTYETGKVYVFNSYHYHNVFNHSDDSMIMIRFYLDLRDKDTYEMVKLATEQYDGELIETYTEFIARI